MLRVIGSQADPAYERRVVALLTVGFGLTGLDRWIISPLFPTMATDLHLSYQDMGSLIGALGIAWGVFSIIGGGLSDRLGRRRVLVPAILAFSLLSGFSGVVGGFAGLLAIRIIMGANEGAFCPVSFATVSEASRPSRRGLNLGITQSAFPLFGLALGPILATQLLRLMSWRGVFMLVAVPGLIVAVLLHRTVREPPTIGASPHEHRAPLGEILQHRNVPLDMLALLCAMSGIFSLSAMVPSYLVDFLKLGTAQMGFVTSAIGLLTGAIAAEAAPKGLVSSTTGLIVACGEIFGGGIAPVLAGTVAEHFGIQHTLSMAIIGLALGIIVCLFLRETAPRLVGRKPNAPAV